jgi:diguanylate cyclase
LDIDTEASETEQWKRKYFDQLEQLEDKEKQWQQADDLLRKTISRLTLAADGQDENLDRQLRELRNAVRDHASSLQLQTVIDAMSSTLIKLDRQHKPAAEDSAQPPPRGGLLQRVFGAQKKPVPSPADERGPAADDVAAAGDGESVREILIRLLERLSLPDELLERLDAIRGQIEHTAAAGSWDAILEQIADLVQAIRAQTQQEKQGVENFLLQLSESLQEVDRQLALSGQNYDDSFAAGEQLDSAVKQGINGIESSVREATDLNQIKQLVQVHIDKVLAHMSAHRAAEQQRYDKAKADMSTMNERLQALEGESAALRSRIREERSQAQTDALTGIPNRLAYQERLEQEIARWKRFSTPLVLLIWDVDHFKRINDSFGHKAGDKALRTIARTLAGSIRETDFIARYGGEEFVHLMTGAELVDCMAVADQLRERVAATGFHFRGSAVTITASCGLAQFRDGDSAESWFERADKALYRAKQVGRNRCEPAP